MLLSLMCGALPATALVVGASGRQAEVTIHPDEVIAHVSQYMTGACLEDVNHEVYGGIYSQMVFGESFQEPPADVPIAGFTAYDGAWHVGSDGALRGAAAPGAKLVSDQKWDRPTACGVEIRFADRAEGNAGLVFPVVNAGRGADRLTAYEISLDPSRNLLVLGKHEQNWQPLAEEPVDIAVGEWIRLTARLDGGTIAAEVDGRPALSFRDPRQPIVAGAVGVRVWNREASFRGLWVEHGSGRHALPLARSEPEGLGGQVSGMWRPSRRGSARGTFSLVTESPHVGAQSQRMVFEGGSGAVGLANRGLNHWGMCFRAGRDYDGCLWARCSAPTALAIEAQSAQGEATLGRTVVTVPDGGWQRVGFSLVPSADEHSGRLAVLLEGPGQVDLGYVSLHPGERGRFHGLPVRRDVGEALQDQGLTVLRYGGCMVNTDEYRWKRMIGPRDQRQPYRGFWYPYSTNGWGIVDFVDFCRAAGFLSIPAFNMGESPEDMRDFVEYMNGPSYSEWGKRRAADGHPEPYHLRFIQLGNEEAVNEEYFRRFKPMAEAIWATDPDITIVVGDFAYGQPIMDPFDFPGNPVIQALTTHRDILELAQRYGREVWFDVHVGSERPEAVSCIDPLPSLAAALEQLCPGARFKLAVCELNANQHDVGRGLANARAINQLERMGDLVRIVCSANCLQPDGQNDNGWNQGLLFLNPSQVWPQAPYFVTQMLSEHYLPQCVRADVSGQTDRLDVTAKTSSDGGTIQLQIVNWAAEPTRLIIRLAPSGSLAGPVHRVELSGEIGQANTATAPDNVRPVAGDVDLAAADGSAECVLPPRSFTVLRAPAR